MQRRLYPLDGNDQDWHRHAHGTLAFLWEGGEDWLSHPPHRFRASARGAWLALAKRFVEGPSLSVRVRDAAGRPLVAEVRIEEIEHHEGERFTTRCRDGRLDQLLPAPGDYTVVVSAGKQEVKRKRTVGKERVELDVYLPVVVTQAAECPTPTRAGGRSATVVEMR